MLWTQGFLEGSALKNFPAMQGMWVQSLGGEDTLEEDMATPSSIPAWKISGTEGPGELQSKGSKRMGHNWATKQSRAINMHN